MSTRPSPAEANFLAEVLREAQELVVLQQTDQDTVLRLANLMEEVRVDKGETVVSQGELSANMYIVAEGELSIEREASEERRTKPAARGSYFGAVCLLGNTPQKATVVAKSGCRLWRLDRDAFDTLVLGPQAALTAAAMDAEEKKKEEEEEDDDEEENSTCQSSDLKEIFVVSDSTGESGSASVYAAMRQFDYCFGGTCGTSRTTVYRFVRNQAEVRRIVRLAADRNALIVYTVMETSVRDALNTSCQELGVECCDLWGALLESMERKFGAKRSGITGRRQAVGESYMRIVKAIEYTRKVDDGVRPNLWNECDIMLIGPSRAGKTPLAFYLAQRGFKVANYPLVPDEEPPPELFTIDQNKCFALMIQPERLRDIRMERMRQFGRTNTKYAAIDSVKKEVSWIKTFYMRRGPRWPFIDTTNAGVIETASRILEILDRRKGDSLAAAVSMEA